MSYYKRTEKESPRWALKPAGKSWGDNTPLSNPQKATLSMTAREAWVVQERAGLVEGSFEDWTHH